MGHALVKLFKNLPAMVLAILLAVWLFAYYSTRDSASPTASQKSEAAEQPLVDTTLLQSAVRMAPLAATPDEQGQAREAWRLADHHLDLTFAAAMREAQAEAALPATGPLQQLSDRIKKLKASVNTDKKRVEDLGKDAGDALDLAQAQLDLDQDELDDAKQDLIRQSGDKRARLQRLLDEHTASEKVADQAIKFGTPGSTGTMNEQLRTWHSLGEYTRQLQVAVQQAVLQTQSLLDQHNTLERQLPSQAEAPASVARLRQLSGQHQTLSSLDQRLQDTKQLVTVYQLWSALVENRRQSWAKMAPAWAIGSRSKVSQAKSSRSDC